MIFFVCYIPSTHRFKKKVKNLNELWSQNYREKLVWLCKWCRTRFDIMSKYFRQLSREVIALQCSVGKSRGRALAIYAEAVRYQCFFA